MLSLHSSRIAHQTEAYPGSFSMKRLVVFLLFPERAANPSQDYLNFKVRSYPIIHLVVREIGVKCSAQEGDKTMYTARA